MLPETSGRRTVGMDAAAKERREGDEGKPALIAVIVAPVGLPV